MNENPNPTGEQATTDANPATADNTAVGSSGEDKIGVVADRNNGGAELAAEQAGLQAEATADAADAVPTAEDKYNAAHAQRTEPRPGDGSYTPNHDHIGTPAEGVDDAPNEA